MTRYEQFRYSLTEMESSHPICRPFKPPSGWNKTLRLRKLLSLWTLFILAIATQLVGCANNPDRSFRRAVALASIGSKEIVQVEHINRGELSSSWKRWWAKPEPPSDRTALLLRKYNLESVYQNEPDRVIDWLHELVLQEPTLEEVHALAELAYQQASWSQQTGNTDRALKLYAASIIHAYHFLFDQDLDLERNAYDPQFRSICDVYNRSLEGLLREICQRDEFAQGYSTTIGSDKQGIELIVQVEGRWRDEQFERFELVNDYRTEGFKNQHHTYGLGAPLIAVRQQQQTHQQPFEKYYPPDLSLPLTAFLHLLPTASGANQGSIRQVAYETEVLAANRPRRGCFDTLRSAGKNPRPDGRKAGAAGIGHHHPLGLWSAGSPAE